MSHGARTPRQIAAKYEVDPRTLERARREGPEVIRGEAVRTRVRRALRELAPETPPPSGRRA